MYGINKGISVMAHFKYTQKSPCHLNLRKWLQFDIFGVGKNDFKCCIYSALKCFVNTCVVIVSIIILVSLLYYV